MLEIKPILPEQRDILPEQFARKPAFIAREDGRTVGYCVYDVEPDCAIMLDIFAENDDPEVLELELRAVAAFVADDFEWFAFGCDSEAANKARKLVGAAADRISTEKLLHGSCEGRS